MGILSAKFTMIGHGPIVFGKPVHEAKRDNEKDDQWAERIWKEKTHVDEDGHLCIPATAVHRSLITASKWLSEKLEGKKTYTRRFESGVICHQQMFKITRNGKPLAMDNVERFNLYAPTNGERGGPKRVWKAFPRVMPKWEIEVNLLITDEAITEAVFAKHARCAGLHDGIGSMRIGKAGPNGMWELSNLELSEYTL